jgi:hypothetical protein
VLLTCMPPPGKLRRNELLESSEVHRTLQLFTR